MGDNNTTERSTPLKKRHQETPPPPPPQPPPHSHHQPYYPPPPPQTAPYEFHHQSEASSFQASSSSWTIGMQETAPYYPHQDADYMYQYPPQHLQQPPHPPPMSWAPPPPSMYYASQPSYFPVPPPILPVAPHDHHIQHQHDQPPAGLYPQQIPPLTVSASSSITVYGGAPVGSMASSAPAAVQRFEEQQLPLPPPTTTADQSFPVNPAPSSSFSKSGQMAKLEHLVNSGGTSASNSPIVEFSRHSSASSSSVSSVGPHPPAAAAPAVLSGSAASSSSSKTILESINSAKKPATKSRSADRSELTFKRILEDSDPELTECTEQVRVWVNERNVHYFDCTCNRRKPTHDLKKIKKHIVQLHHTSKKPKLRIAIPVHK
eukprot:TRINITY_DN12573_c0_g1_i1.p1 TRINITY_DN12573_c0_g1~~TRINITY_DN12573_c0_g1_i1.p1  ORF type:complete len:376 (-),score=73.91 TRINITY_DN12573_c0_g1_i1:50-1177(-)